jgi:SAM-dependent MidA family methyltransferase
MADALRAITQAAPRFRAALSVHLIETSARLRAIQQGAVPDATWHASIATLPRQPMLLLANEFLDALPIRQFVRRGRGWAERYVRGGRWQELPSACTDLFERHVAEMGDIGEGDIVEIREPALDLAAALGAELTSRAGAALFLDYGASARAVGDSLQAIRDGRPADPLLEPGTADLTAHVDFASFAEAARDAGAAVDGPVAQGMFLTRLGLFQRTDRLARNQPPGRALALIDAARRLAEPDRMGRLFKALVLCHPGCPALPGFES